MVVGLFTTVGCTHRATVAEVDAAYWSDFNRRQEIAKANLAAQSPEPEFKPWMLEDMARRRELDRKEAALHRQMGYRQSEVAECTSRANAVYGDIVRKMRVRDDCLEAGRLRRRGL
jgi:G:T-mismatch repair DNA endonuclease (very short patch repair protein)